jgi:hypothetical protein
MIVALASLALAGCQTAEQAAPAPAPSATTAGAPAAATPGKKSDTPVQSPSGSAVQPQ